MRVLKGFDGLLHLLEFSIGIDRLRPAEVRNYLEVFVEDGDETRLLSDGVAALEDGGIEIVAIDHGAADPGAGEGDGTQVFSFHGISLEGILLAAGHDEEGPSGMTAVDGDAMGIEQVFFF